MNRLLACAGLLVLTTLGVAGVAPYDESANAEVEVQQALTAARVDHKPVLLVFGANWCPDCRELDQAMHGTSRALIEGHFAVVKIDVGNFDKNLDLAQRYGNPIKQGIPAIVVLSSAGAVSYSSKGGELANARRMGATGIYDFLNQHLAGGGS
jgi:protein disulfide-isomerase